MEFIFRITQYKSEALEDEVAVSLEKQLELNSRKKLPAMWRYIDRINSRLAPKGVIKQRKILRKIYGSLLILMGVFLLVPGLMEPKELLVPLIAGLISVTTGLVCVLPRRKRSNRKFYKIAEELLAGMGNPIDVTTETPLLVHFTAEGMKLPNNSLTLYRDFQSIIEAESIFFLVWQEKVTILQKKDLVGEGSETFLTFMEEMTGLQRITAGTVG